MTRDERRQRAREAFHDASPVIDSGVIDEVHEAAERAIETATRVRVTHELVTEAGRGWVSAGNYPFLKATFEAAFRAAGFEVEQ